MGEDVDDKDDDEDGEDGESDDDEEDNEDEMKMRDAQYHKIQITSSIMVK